MRTRNLARSLLPFSWSLLLLLVSVSLPPSLSYEGSLETAGTQTSAGRGSRIENLDIMSYWGNRFLLDADLTSGVIDFSLDAIDPAVKPPRSDYSKYSVDPNVVLSKARPQTTQIEGMPDLGQHSDMWCWAGAAANAFYWLSERGYPELVNDSGGVSYMQIDSGSLDPANLSWHCPCGAGYPRLLSTVASHAGLVFDQTVAGAQEYVDCLRGFVDAQGLSQEFTVDLEKIWTWVPIALRENLGNSSAVLIDLKPGLADEENQTACNVVGHVVTGISFDGQTLTFVDSATDQHRNDPTGPIYETAYVFQSLPLEVTYNGEIYWVNWVASIAPSVYAYRREVTAVRLQKGLGLFNKYTLLNCNRTPPRSTDRLDVGMLDNLFGLNALYPSNPSEGRVLDLLYESLLWNNPDHMPSNAPDCYQLMQPGVAQDWLVEEWNDKGESKTKVTYWIRQDVGIVEPGTGSFVRNFNAHDFEFSIWFIYAFKDSYVWKNFSRIHHTVVPEDDPYKIEVYFDALSSPTDMLFNDPIYPLLTRNELMPKLTQPKSITFNSDGMNCSTGSEFKFASGQDQAVDVISAKIDGTPLLGNTDYYLRGGSDVGYEHNVIVWLRDQPMGTVTLEYYTTAETDPKGSCLGERMGWSWFDTMYSLSLYYVVGWYFPGFASLVRNSHFFLETPLLGELDWRWDWDGFPQPRKGHYRIAIFDIVRITSVYGSTGCGPFRTSPMPPSLKWDVAADVSPSPLPSAPLYYDGRGNINIYDLVTASGKYARTSGSPP